MHPERPKVSSVDEYIGLFPAETQKHLEQLRTTIRKVFPEFTETISYSIPAYKKDPKKRALVYFAAYETHISLHAVLGSVEDTELAQQVESYVTGKGTIRFDLDKPFPIELIEKILEYHRDSLRV
jgi:uncharacterized protein YdhG (YjbR/CyaY superfamily)